MQQIGGKGENSVHWTMPMSVDNRLFSAMAVVTYSWSVYLAQREWAIWWMICCLLNAMGERHFHWVDRDSVMTECGQTNGISRKSSCSCAKTTVYTSVAKTHSLVSVTLLHLVTFWLHGLLPLCRAAWCDGTTEVRDIMFSAHNVKRVIAVHIVRRWGTFGLIHEM